MGCGTSSFASANPLKALKSNPESVVIAKQRKDASKLIQTDLEGLCAAHASYTAALKNVGACMVIMCDEIGRTKQDSYAGVVMQSSTATSISNSLSTNPPLAIQGAPPALYLTGVEGASGASQGSVTQNGAPASADDEAESAPDGPPPGPQQGQATYGTPPPRPDGPAGPNPNAGAIILHQSGGLPMFPGRSGGNTDEITEVAKQLNKLFVQAMEATVQLGDFLVPKLKLDKASLPPLTMAAAQKSNGQLESFGDTVVKLINWERHLKDEIEALENAKSMLDKHSGKLTNTQSKAQAKPDSRHADPRKLRNMEVKVQETQGRLQAYAQSVETSRQTIERFKGELLQPQLLRAFPVFMDTFLKVSNVHEQQRMSSADITVPDGGLLLAKGGITRQQMDATTAMNEALKKWQAASVNFVNAQKKLVNSTTTWIQKTENYTPPPLPSGYGPPPLAPALTGQSVGGPLLNMCGAWTRQLDTIQDKDVQASVTTICDSLAQASKMQAEEMKLAKQVADLAKQTDKAAKKLDEDEKKMRQHELATQGPAVGQMDAKELKEHQAREAKGLTLQSTLEASRVKLESLTRSLNDEKRRLDASTMEAKVASLAALQKGLPMVFASAGGYAAVVSQAYGILQFNFNADTMQKLMQQQQQVPSGNYQQQPGGAPPMQAGGGGYGNVQQPMGGYQAPAMQPAY